MKSKNVKSDALLEVKVETVQDLLLKTQISTEIDNFRKNEININCSAETSGAFLATETR